MYTACPATLHGWYLIYYLGSIYRTMKALAWDMMEGISDRCTYLAKRKYFHSGQNGKTNISIWQKANFSESKVSISTNWRKQTKPLFSGLKRWTTVLQIISDSVLFQNYTTMQDIHVSWALLSRKVVIHHFTFGFALTFGFICKKQAHPLFNLIFAVKKESGDTSFHIRIYLQKTSTTTF